MSAYKVLVDSSVWIEFFKKGNVPYLEKLIQEDLVCTNEVILSELGPLLMHRKKWETWDSLCAFEIIPLELDWDQIRYYQLLNLRNGINRLGVPDVIIIQQVIMQKLTLFSFDKHFKLMRQQLNFELIDGM